MKPDKHPQSSAVQRPSKNELNPSNSKKHKYKTPVSPAIFKEHPEIYHHHRFNTRINLLDSVLKDLLNSPQVNLPTVYKEAKRMMEAAEIPADPEQYVRNYYSKGNHLQRGGRQITVNLSYICGLVEYLKDQGYMGSMLHHTAVVWFAYYTYSLAYGKEHGTVEIYDKKGIVGLSQMSQKTIRKYENHLIGLNILHKEVIRIRNKYPKRFAMPLEFKTLLKLKVAKAPKVSQARTRECFSSVSTKFSWMTAICKLTRHQKDSMVTHLALQRKAKGYIRHKTIPLFEICGHNIKCQVEFANLDAILAVILDKSSIRKFWGMEDIRSMKTIENKLHKWCKNVIPVYKKRIINYSPNFSAKQKVRPLLDDLEDVGICFDGKAAINELGVLSNYHNIIESIDENSHPSFYLQYVKSLPEISRSILSHYAGDAGFLQRKKAREIHSVLKKLIAEWHKTGEGALKGQFEFGKSTGRICSRKLNLQGVRKSTRHLFKSRSGYKLLRIDNSSQDLTTVIHLAADRNGLDMLRNNVDIYSVIARELGCERDTIKFAVNAFLYGSNGSRKCDALYKYLGSKEKVEMFLGWMKASLPQVVEFRELAIHDAQQYGMSLPTPMGFSALVVKQRYNPRKDQWQNVVESTKARGYTIQATSSELLMNLIINLRSLLPANARIIMPVHDEIIFEVRENDLQKVVEIYGIALKLAANAVFNNSRDEDADSIECIYHFKAKYGKTWADNQTLSAETAKHSDNMISPEVECPEMTSYGDSRLPIHSQIQPQIQPIGYSKILHTIIVITYMALTQTQAHNIPRNYRRGLPLPILPTPNTSNWQPQQTDSRGPPPLNN